jgi:hypothetical protein
MRCRSFFRSAAPGISQVGHRILVIPISRTGTVPPMSNLQRILNMASKALDKKGQPSSGGAGKTDWREMVRTAADKVTGDDRTQSAPAQRGTAASPAQTASPEDRAAIARYDYLLKTAAPEQLEQVHRDAFARLTPAQREQVGAQLRADLPAGEQPLSSSADDLARSATRGEATRPGFLRSMFSKPGAAMAGAGAVAGVGIGAAGGLLAAVAGGAVLSSVAGPLLEQAAGMGVDFESLAGGFDGLSEGAGEYASGLGEQASELGSNFEIPGLGSIGDFFGRN